MDPKIKSYNGNPNLKRSQQKIQFTPDMVQEWLKCSQDPVYFTETYMKIISIDKGLISFKLYDYQKEMLRSMKDNRYTIIATARQAGKSTTTCAFILWYVLFHGEKTVALLANKGETAREILGRIQLAFQHLPKWLQQGVKEWNKGSFELENNSRVIASSTSSDNIRGYSINLLFIDEAAFIENWDSFFTSVYPTISSGKDSKIVLVSTPNGLNHFYSIWVNASEKRNQYEALKVMWHDVPGRDEKWRVETLSGMNFDTQKFEQEYCVEFMGSSGTLISGWKLKELVHLNTLHQNEGLYVYKQPEAGHSYVLVADVSRGKGLDYSAFQLIDVTIMPYQQVAIYRNNNVTPYDFATTINQIGRIYNKAAVLVEINDIGESVSVTLHNELEYENVLFTENAGRSGKRITTGFGGSSIDKGIRTTKVVKAVGCSMLKLLVEQNQLVINDFNTIAELGTFSKKANSFEAESGHHDDLVMCLVLFGWLTDQQYFKEYTNINTLMKLRDKTDEDIENDLIPFGFVDIGEDLDVILDPTPFRGNWLYRDDSEEFQNI